MNVSIGREPIVVVADIGGTHIQIGHMRGGSKTSTIKKLSSDCLRTDKPAEVLINLFSEYARTNGLSLDAVVIGVPGLLDADRQNISHCNNIPQLEGAGLRAQLSTVLECPVYLEQDIMLQVLGEWHNGAAKRSDAVFGVYFGTGIGTAYLRDGDPFQRGASTLQAGHIPVSNMGKPCPCGNTDCVEAYASGHTLNELAEQHAVPVAQLFTSCGGAKLTQALDEFITYQSFLIASVITITEPDTLLIGGGIASMAGYPREKLMQTVKKHLQKPVPAETVNLCWAARQETAALYGAVALINIYQQQTQA